MTISHTLASHPQVGSVPKHVIRRRFNDWKVKNLLLKLATKRHPFIYLIDLQKPYSPLLDAYRELYASSFKL